MKSFFAALALCALLVPAGAGEQVQFVDSKIGIYVKYGGQIFGSIRSNPSVIPIMPNFRTTLFLDDQSKVEMDYRGPFVGAKTTEAPGRLSPKESIRVRYVVPDRPGTCRNCVSKSTRTRSYRSPKCPYRSQPIRNRRPSVTP